MKRKSKYQKELKRYEQLSKRIGYKNIKEVEEIKKEFEGKLPKIIDDFFENMFKDNNKTKVN